VTASGAWPQSAALTHMGSVGVRALQQHASEVVRRAAAGEIVEVTDRGRLVARLVPAGGSSQLDALVAAGLARPATMSLGDLGPPLRATPGRASLGELLDRARSAER